MKISCVTYSYVAEPHDYSAAAERGTAEARVLAFVDSVLDRLGAGLLDGIEFWFAHVPANILTPLLYDELHYKGIG